MRTYYFAATALAGVTIALKIENFAMEGQVTDTKQVAPTSQDIRDVFGLAFDLIDSDDDGSLSQDEVVEALSAIKEWKKISEEQWPQAELE